MFLIVNNGGFRHVNCLLFCFGCFVIGHIRQGIARIKRAQAAPDPSQVLLALIRHRWTPVLSVCCLCQTVRIPPPRMRGGNSYIICHLREHVGLVFYQFQALLVSRIEYKDIGVNKQPHVLMTFVSRS